MENHVVGEVAINSQADENRIISADFQVYLELFYGFPMLLITPNDHLPFLFSLPLICQKSQEKLQIKQSQFFGDQRQKTAYWKKHYLEFRGKKKKNARK